MEQDRWVKESEPNHKGFKSIMMFGVVAVVIIGISILSCGKTKVKRIVTLIHLNLNIASKIALQTTFCVNISRRQDLRDFICKNRICGQVED